MRKSGSGRFNHGRLSIVNRCLLAFVTGKGPDGSRTANDNLAHYPAGGFE